MVALNVKELLKKLVVLQKIDEELFAFRREIREKPEEIAHLKAQFEAKQALYNKLETQSRDLELAKKAKELDLKAKEQDLVKADQSLMVLKSNKEYQAKLFEIENMKADKSQLEDAILKQMDDLERVNKALEAEKALVAQEEKAYLAEKEKIDAAILKLKEDSAHLETRRREAMQNIEKEPLAVYERIVENRDGVAMVPVVNNACGGCFMHLPPQVLNKIRMYEEVVRCEACARLLYLQEEMA